MLTDYRKMGDGGYSNIYEVYGEDGELLALKVWQNSIIMESTIIWVKRHLAEWCGIKQPSIIDNSHSLLGGKPVDHRRPH